MDGRLHRALRSLSARTRLASICSVGGLVVAMFCVLASPASAATGAISGTVTDASSHTGVQGISVMVYDSTNAFVASTSTGPDGTYTASGLLGGSYKVQFSGMNYLMQFYSGKSSLATADAVSVTPGQTATNVDAALQLGGTISGTVTDTSNAGIANVFVSASGPSIMGVCTRPDGTYTISGLPTGSYRVEFSTSGFDPCGASGSYLPQYYSGKSSLATADAVSVTAGQTTANIDATMQPGGTISGKVTDTANAAIPDETVSIYDSNDNFVNSETTDGNGNYSVGGLTTGSYKVQFSGRNYLTQYYNGKSSLATADAVSVTVGHTTTNIDASVQQAGTITGTVTDASTHLPLSGMAVGALDSSGNIVTFTFTAADGTYSLTGLASGSYKVGFEDFSHNVYLTQYYSGKSSVAAADLVSVTAGQTTPNIDAAMQQGGMVSGTVTDTSNAAIAGETVSVYDSTGTSVSSGTTDGNGNYTVGGLATGSYKVEFSGGNYLAQYYSGKSSLAAADAVSVTVGQTTTGINATMQPAGSITGTVTDASTHQPLSGIAVGAFDSGGNLVTFTFTANDGTYSLGGLVSGSYKVGFEDFFNGGYASEYYSGKLIQSAADTVPVTVGQTTSGIDQALPTAGRIAGTVTDASSSVGVANLEVDVLDPSGNLVTSVCTGGDGSYTVSRLVPGSYRVRFTSTGCGSSSYSDQYYNRKSSFGAADPVAVTGGQTASGIDAAMTTGPPSLAQFAIKVSSPRTAGAPFTVKVFAEDAGGNTLTNYAGSPSWSDSAGQLSGSPAAFVNGVSTNTVTFANPAHSDRITVADSGASVSSQSSGFNVTGPLAKFGMSVSSPVHAGQPFTVKVSAEDAAGNTVTSYAGSPSWSDSSGQLSGSPAAFVNGVSTNTVTLANPYRSDRITVADSGASVSSQSGGFNVIGPLAKFVISVPSPEYTGQAFTAKVSALDAVGNTVTNYAGSPSWSDSSGQLSGSPAAFANGVSTNTVTLANPYRSDRITITDSGAAVSSQSGGFNVIGPLAKFVISVSSPVHAGQSFTVKVSALDAVGDTVTNYAGSPSWSDSSGQLSGSPAAFANGVSTNTVTLANPYRSDRITVTDSGAAISSQSGAFSVST